MNTYVAYTPYHVLLACGIATAQCRESSASNTLVTVADFDGAYAMAAYIREWEQSPFEEVVVLPGTAASGKGLKRTLTVMFRKRRNIRAIRSLLVSQVAQKVFVFNDERPESQACCALAKRSNSDTLVYYVEDGSGAYSASSVPLRSPLARFVRRVAYGPFSEDVQVFGTGSSTEAVMVGIPALARKELRDKPIESLPLEEFRSDSIRSLVRRTIAERISETDLGSLGRNILVLPTISTMVDDHARYKDVVLDVVSRVRALGYGVWLKYHPLEPHADYCGAVGIDGVAVLPSTLSAEFLFLAFGNKLSGVIGDNTTALITVRWILDSVASLSISRLVGNVDNVLLEVYREVGTVVLETAAGIDGTLGADSLDQGGLVP